MNRPAMTAACIVVLHVFSHAITTMMLESRENFHRSTGSTIMMGHHCGCTIAPPSKPALKKSGMAQRGLKSEVFYAGSFFVATFCGGVVMLMQYWNFACVCWYSAYC